ncbi:MAG: hypothetical protein SFZ23_11245 [Planctomycetota bacterium]|nr:hypothetical protein [Planctomycetota bacterium]
MSEDTHDPGEPHEPGTDAQPGGTDGFPESDPRFPSGPWVGFYQQGGVQSRQRMRLRFSGGRIEGDGRDPVDGFAVAGTYNVETARCSLVKRYRDYEVEYNGSAGDGIGGVWRIMYHEMIADTGSFHIWPDLVAMDEGLREQAQASQHDTR